MPPRPANTNTGGPTLKNLLKAADTLLKPPTPLSSNPPELLQRLRACSRSLPKEWRRVTPEWCNEDEQEQIGDHSNVQDDVDESRKKRRRDELVFVVGKRCFALINAMQVTLEKEFWPVEMRGDLAQNDFLLGTADLRLIRLMLSHSTFSYLLPLASHYADSLPTVLPKTAESLSLALDSLLKLLTTTAPPTPAAGPSSRAPTPPTIITQTLLSSHLVPVFLSTLIIAYTPSIPGESHAALRSEFMKALISLSPGHAISTMVNVLKLLVQGRKEGVKVNGWVREWPKYPEGIINGLLTAQVRRPGGVRGLMENVLGETAKTDDVTSIEGKRLDHIFNVLVRIPRQVTPEIYYPWLLSELFAMIPLTTHSHLPVAYVNTACYCIQRLWASNRPLIGDWLNNKIHAPWYPKLPTSFQAGKEEIVVTTWEAIQRSVQNMRLLLLHNPSSHDFADFIVGSILVPLFSLHEFLEIRQKGDQIHIQEQGVTVSSAGHPLDEGVASLLVTWGKSVHVDVGVKGIWSIMDGGKGWEKDCIDGDKAELYWEKDGEGVRLMARPTPAKNGTSPIIALPSTPLFNLSHEEYLIQLSAKQSSSPDPQLLCQLIGSLDRPDIASEVILRSLDSWRIRTATEVEPSLESLVNLQLTIQMMEKLGSQLFSKPAQVLGFVERVLNDQIQSLHTTSEAENGEPGTTRIHSEDILEGELHDELAPDGKRGLIEVACQLLASLEAEGQLNKTSMIIRPILSHLSTLSQQSSSVSIRNAAREARLLLSHPLDSEDSRSEDPKKMFLADLLQAENLIDNPGLPVKAYGLKTLKDLTFSPNFDESYSHRIIDILMKEIDNSDSFIYLSAIQGLSGIVDALGKEVFAALVGRYMTGLRDWKQDIAQSKEQEKIERVLRVAEAIDQVAERSADVLAAYATFIVPPLMSVYPDQNLPTVIRSSALSILSTCARVSPYTILSWAAQLAMSTLDLIQVESTASSPFRRQSPVVIATVEEKPKWGKSNLVQLIDDEPLSEEEKPNDEVTQPRITDEEPTKIQDSKHPTLRRAALSLFNWTIRVVVFVEFMSSSDERLAAIDETNILLPSGSPIAIKPASSISATTKHDLSADFLDRASSIIGYIMQRDDDEIVRQHAESALKDLTLLKNGGLNLGHGDNGVKALESLKSLRI
ncbi:uncharacterized protein IL334_003014 [Kwoniella shivajii]|uniref:RNA polymerase II assembly factor Rtp1 C-terminal domain-containing protein n=1 Tax=Kwoniella shivajii TaxID=564305 RepID=A0ABZ1CXI2_9TREE|nr:hypothetical protein IL334_003014 [Kwoniella shivajii]